MTEKIVKLTPNPVTGKYLYPWEELSRIGSLLIIEGPSAFTAREMAYRYGKRRGWKVSGKFLAADRLLVGRVG